MKEAVSPKQTYYRRRKRRDFRKELNHPPFNAGATGGFSLSFRVPGLSSPTNTKKSTSPKMDKEIQNIVASVGDKSDGSGTNDGTSNDDDDNVGKNYQSTGVNEGGGRTTSPIPPATTSPSKRSHMLKRLRGKQSGINTISPVGGGHKHKGLMDIELLKQIFSNMDTNLDGIIDVGEVSLAQSSEQILTGTGREARGVGGEGGGTATPAKPLPLRARIESAFPTLTNACTLPPPPSPLSHMHMQFYLSLKSTSLEDSALALFNKVDKDKNGQLTMKELITHLFPFAEDSDLDNILAWVKTGDDPRQIWTEGEEEKEYKAMFRSFDIDGDKKLTLKELCATMSEVHKLEKKECEKLFLDLGKTKRDVIEEAEFVDLLKTFIHADQLGGHKMGHKAASSGVGGGSQMKDNQISTGLRHLGRIGGAM